MFLLHGDKVHRILFRAEALLLSWRARHRILRTENRKTKPRVLQKHAYNHGLHRKSSIREYFTEPLNNQGKFIFCKYNSFSISFYAISVTLYRRQMSGA